MKKYHRYILIAVIGVIAFLLPHFRPSSILEDRFIGNYPNLKKVSQGMTKPQVIELLGKPKRIIVNYKHLSNFLGQGPSSDKIAEAWVCEYLLWSGAIEIYFDDSGHVIRCNWGYG